MLGWDHRCSQVQLSSVNRSVWKVSLDEHQGFAWTALRVSRPKEDRPLGEHTGQDAERVGNLTCQEEGCFSTVF